MGGSPELSKFLLLCQQKLAQRAVSMAGDCAVLKNVHISVIDQQEGMRHITNHELYTATTTKCSTKLDTNFDDAIERTLSRR